METEARKASDIILQMESKIDALLSLVRTQDLNIKILSNKINSLTEKMSVAQHKITTAPDATSPRQQTPFYSIESADVAEKTTVSINPEDAIPIEENPVGFRRSSRPETYDSKPMLPTQPPIIVPQQAEIVVPQMQEQPLQTSSNVDSTVSVVQKVFDKNGKTIFLADVEVIDADTKETVAKTRTNGAGKWIVSVKPGSYKVLIKKRESLNKEKLEISQSISVDGASSKVELPQISMK